MYITGRTTSPQLLSTPRTPRLLWHQEFAHHITRRPKQSNAQIAAAQVRNTTPQVGTFLTHEVESFTPATQAIHLFKRNSRIGNFSKPKLAPYTQMQECAHRYCHEDLHLATLEEHQSVLCKTFLPRNYFMKLNLRNKLRFGFGFIMSGREALAHLESHSQTCVRSCENV